MCNCVDRVNEILKKRNTCLTLPYVIIMDTGKPDLHAPRMMIATEKINTKIRGRARSLFAAYCPVCGEKYPKRLHEAAAPADPPLLPEKDWRDAVRAALIGRGIEAKLAAEMSDVGEYLPDHTPYEVADAEVDALNQA